MGAFGLLALLAGWRGLLSPWMTAAALPIVAAVTLRTLETPSGVVYRFADAAAPIVLMVFVLVLWGIDFHVRLGSLRCRRPGATAGRAVPRRPP